MTHLVHLETVRSVFVLKWPRKVRRFQTERERGELSKMERVEGEAHLSITLKGGIEWTD